MTKFCAIKMVTCIRILMEIKLLPFSGVCLKLPKKKKRKTHNRNFVVFIRGFRCIYISSGAKFYVKMVSGKYLIKTKHYLLTIKQVKVLASNNNGKVNEKNEVENDKHL